MTGKQKGYEHWSDPKAEHLELERPASNTPAVTVLMAVYNGERHVRESIESILDQTLGDFEFLVVDDGSTDASRAIVDSFADSRLRLLTNPGNLGLTSSLNVGLREARGAYVARQDADDTSEPNRLERQVAYLEANPAIAVLGTAYYRIDEEGRRTGQRTVPTDSRSARWRLLFLNAFPHTSVMIRRAVLSEVGTYDEQYRYAQDYELWSRVAARYDIAGLSEPLVSYRSSPNSLTATYTGAGSEVEQISGVNMQHVMTIGGNDSFDPARVDRESAWRLLFGDWRRVDAVAAARTVPDILALQIAFGHATGDTRSSRLHRARVARSLTVRLGRLALRRLEVRSLSGVLLAGTAWAVASLASLRPGAGK